jgi:hypothetical protein
MSSITFKVTSRSLDLGHKMPGVDGTSLLSGLLKLSGNNKVLFIGGLNPQSPTVHARTQLGSHPWGIIFVPFSEFHIYVDAANREEELYVSLDDSNPSQNKVVNYPIS